jgi:hypothetical protein
LLTYSQRQLGDSYQYLALGISPPKEISPPEKPTPRINFQEMPPTRSLLLCHTPDCCLVFSLDLARLRKHSQQIYPCYG